MSEQQQSLIRHHSSQFLESAKSSANAFVPGASLFVLVKDASGTHIKWVDDDDETSAEEVSALASEHTPDEKTRLTVTGAIEETPPFVACFAFCFLLNIMLACLFLGILIIYLHYRFGFTTDPYEEELCNYMRAWNRKLLWLFVATCGLGMVDLIGLCVVLAKMPNQDGYDTIPPMNQQVDIQETAQSVMPCWTKTRSILKYAIDVVFFVWMIQAFWATNYDVTGTQECPNMYTFTHIYSTIVSVLAVLGIIAACLLGCLVVMYGKRSSNANSTTLEMDV